MLRRAFTLIELLVVVAIIAILAAIALPNLIEAQTRAKVARAKADIRTIVLGLEAYRVDHNGYPTYHYPDVDFGYHGAQFHIGGRMPDWGVPDPGWNGSIPITTPVAYLTSYPRDPFAPVRNDVPPEVHEYLYVNWDYAIQQTSAANLRDVFVYARLNYGPYRIHSRGPDLDVPDPGLPYDATNGVTSDGDITYGASTGFDRIVHFDYVPFPSSR